MLNFMEFTIKIKKKIIKHTGWPPFAGDREPCYPENRGNQRKEVFPITCSIGNQRLDEWKI